MTTPMIKFIVPVALKEVMAHLVPAFARESGYGFQIVHMLNPEVPSYIAKGADWDIAITNPCHIAEIRAEGHMAADSHRAFARSPLAFAMRGTATSPPRYASDHIAEILQQADSIAITKTGTSGDMFRRLAKHLGVWDAVEPKLREMKGGAPMTALIAGEVDLAALPLTNIAPLTLVFPVGICPLDFGVHIDLSLCLSKTASTAARAFADWLIDPARDVTLRKLGSERFI